MTPVPLIAILPYLPQLVNLVVGLITRLIEATKGMSEKEIQEWLKKSAEEIKLGKTFRYNESVGKFEWV